MSDRESFDIQPHVQTHVQTHVQIHVQTFKYCVQTFIFVFLSSRVEHEKIFYGSLMQNKMPVINKDFDDYLKNEVESGEIDQKANRKRKQVKPSFFIDECAKES